jgi:Tfp pilus assembly major pilin PilA
MMQSTGKGLSGIAEGAAVGTKQYAEGKKASELARQKMEDARDAFDEFKFNAGNMAQKDVTAAKRAIVAGANAADQMGITAKAADLAHQYESANKLFTATAAQQEGVLDRASRERTAAISAQVQKEIAAMPGAAERMYATFGGGDAKKGFEYFTAATAEGKGTEAIMQLVLKTPGILETLSPELRKAVETEAMGRFTPGTVPGKAVPAAQVRAP